MKLDEFKLSLKQETPPSGLTLAVQGLWHDAKGDWEAAHECAQSQDDQEGAWVHAYLHRKEGDAGNAAYWYSRAGKPVNKGSLENEWEEMVGTLLS